MGKFLRNMKEELSEGRAFLRKMRRHEVVLLFGTVFGVSYLVGTVLNDRWEPVVRALLTAVSGSAVLFYLFAVQRRPDPATRNEKMTKR